ncbi:putative quinol monooxygenase [Salana multivorans]
MIVVGHLLVDPVDRDRAIEPARPAVLAARTTPGCIDFAVSPDPVDPARVNVSERWTDRTTLEHFRDAGPSGELADLIQEAAVEEYET